ANNAGLTLTGPTAYFTSGSSVTASKFMGDGSALTGIPSTGSIVGVYLQKTGDSMSGPLSMLNNSTITVTGNAFSVGTSSFVIVGSSVGIRTAVPATALDVNEAAQFGYGANKSTFTNLGALLLANNAGLTLTGPTAYFT